MNRIPTGHDTETAAPDPLHDRLRDLLATPAGLRIPAKADEAVRAAIRGEAERIRRSHSARILRLSRARRFGWAAAVAAAAVAVFAAVPFFSHPMPCDLDGDGRVDIVDAYRMHRALETPGERPEAWDLDGSGRVDEGDVEMLLGRIVRIDAEPGGRL